LAAFRELKPFLELAPAGLARTLFEERVAKRLDVSPAALVAEVEVAPESARVAPRSPQAPAPRPARAAAAKGWGPAVDALGLLASFPQLGEVAREEHIFALFGEGPLTELVRELLAGTVSPQELPARLEGHLAPALIAHVRDMLGPARPPTDAAAGALRKAIMLARVALLEQEYDRLNAAVARAGTPAPRDLVEEQITTWRRLADLKKRLDAVERG